jgi:hypothetical protein
LKVNIDIVLPRFPCDIVSLDAQDIMGSHHVNVGGDLYKRRLDRVGNIIEEIKHNVRIGNKIWQNKENISESQVDFARVKQAYSSDEGCQLVGSIEVNKVEINLTRVNLQGPRKLPYFKPCLPQHSQPNFPR